MLEGGEAGRREGQEAGRLAGWKAVRIGKIEHQKVRGCEGAEFIEFIGYGKFIRILVVIFLHLVQKHFQPVVIFASFGIRKSSFNCKPVATTWRPILVR